MLTGTLHSLSLRVGRGLIEEAEECDREAFDLLAWSNKGGWVTRDTYQLGLESV
jgi:hypothetical protein